MHPCLCVDEILRLVFRCIEDRSTLCALARTCQTFNEPATDLIWETLTAMEPILQHLPSAKFMTRRFDNRRYLVLSHPLSDNDWSIFQQLSSRVRRFHTFFNYVPSHGYVDNDVPQWLGSLTSPPGPSFLFPNLRALSFEFAPGLSSTNLTHPETCQAVVRFFHLLLGPHLSALRLDIPGALYADLDLSSIPALCPNIRILSIGRPSIDQRVQIPENAVYLFSRAVSEFCGLAIFRSCVTSWHLLSILAQAKALRRLCLYLPRKLGPPPECLRGNNFLQLRTLEIWIDSLAWCTDLLRRTSFHQVTEMCIHCSASQDDGDPFQELVDLSSLISSQCKLLEFLWISSNFIRNRNVTPPSAWRRRMLEPYRACRHLRIIALQVSYSLTLADNDLEDMVKAWPHLEVFHLLPDDRVDPPVHLTLRGVTALLCHCPKLKDFTLMFDATRVPEGVTRRSYRTLVRNTAVRYMGVHASPVSESSDVAEYLSTIMPCLQSIGVRTRVNYYGAKWLWICIQHQRKPTIQVNIPLMELYSVLTAGTESASNEQMYGREWCWISPGGNVGGK